MNLKQLQYFTSIADLGSFTAAARVLGVVQPALSRHVRALEVELGQVLLRRNGRGVSLTENGNRLLAHCRGILHQVERAKEDVGGNTGSLSGHVIIGLPPTVANLVAVGIARRFRDEFPDATLSIRVELSAVMRDWLTTGRLDIALLYNPVPSPELELTLLAHEPLYLVGRGGAATPKTVTLKELGNLPIVIPSRPHRIRMLVESELLAIGAKPNIAWEVDGIPTILGLVADGAGYAVLSQQAIATARGPKRFHGRLVVKPQLVSNLYLATAAARAATLTQKAGETVVRAVIKATYEAPLRPGTSHRH